MSDERVSLRQDRQAAFTPERKIRAFAFRFYQYSQWQPKAGDFYTITRADTMLFQIDRIEGDKIYIVNCRHSPEQAYDDPWDADGFTSEGFGVNRLYVPEWIFNIDSALDDF